jgi:hypothetical protein
MCYSGGESKNLECTKILKYLPYAKNTETVNFIVLTFCYDAFTFIQLSFIYSAVQF